MINKKLCIALLSVLLISSVFIISEVDSLDSDDSFTYTDASGVLWDCKKLADGTVTLQGCTLNSGDTSISLVSEVTDENGDRYKVSRVSAGFTLNGVDKNNISKICVPNTINTIETTAFRNYSNLSEVQFEENSTLSSIGAMAFQGSGKSNHGLLPPSGPYVVSEDDFWMMFIFISVPSDGNILLEIHLPEGVEYGKDHLELCKSNEFTEPSELESYRLVDNGGVTLNSYDETSRILKFDVNLALGSQSSVLCLMDATNGYLANIYLDKIYAGLAVNIPDSVKEIGASAFDQTTEVILSENSNLQKISDYAFMNITNKVVFPATLSELGICSFNPAAGVDFAPGGTFSVDAQGNVTTDDGKTLVAYAGTEESYQLNEKIVEVRNNAFVGNTSIKTITISDDIEWGMFPFGDVKNYGQIEKLPGTSIEHVVFKDGIKQIPGYMFSGTHLIKVTIPSSVESIGTKAFYNIPTLESVEFGSLGVDGKIIPSSLVDIGSYSFSSNPALETVIFKASSSVDTQGNKCKLIISEGAFYNCNSLGLVDFGKINLIDIGYAAFAKDLQLFSQSGSNYKNFKTINVMNGYDPDASAGINIPCSVETIGAAAFSIQTDEFGQSPSAEPGAMVLTDRAKFGNVFKINVQGNIAFDGINEDGSNISSSLLSVGDYAFAGYLGNYTVDLKNCTSLSEVGKESFSARTYSLVLPSEGVLSKISDGAFSGCFGEVTVPKTVYEIGHFAFGYKFDRTDAVNVVFPEGSVLKHVSVYDENEKLVTTNIAEAVTLDLSNCKVLDNVTIESKTILPSGVFDIRLVDESKINLIQNNDKVLMNVADVNNRTLEINENTTTINESILYDLKSIVCSEGNPTFYVNNGVLYQHGYRLVDGSILPISILVSVDSTVSKISIESDVDRVRDYAFKDSCLEELRIQGESKDSFELGKYLLEGCNDVRVYLKDKTGTIQDKSFAGSVSKTDFMIDGTYSSNEILWMRSIGHLFFKDSVSGAYLPETVEGFKISYSETTPVQDGFTLSITDIEGGYTIYDVNIQIDGKNAINDGIIHIPNSADSVLDISAKDRKSGNMVTIDFVGNGGICEGKDIVSISVPSGLTLIDSDIPDFIKKRSVIDYWTWNGCEYSLDSVLYKDTVLVAQWILEDPKLILDSSSGIMRYDGQITSEVSNPVSGKSITFEPYNSYEAHFWVVNGVETDIPANDPYVLDDVTDDIKLTVSVTYFSSSIGLDYIVNEDLPTGEELTELSQVFESGCIVDTSGMMWKKHSSVPLIVDDTMYIRSGDRICAVETDTGYVVKSVKSEITTAYYHYLAYGNGLIIDCETGKAYDLDLNLKFKVAGSSNGLPLLEYHEDENGKYFYAVGASVSRLSADSDQPGERSMEYLGKMGGSYTNYSYSGSVFENGWVFRIYASGEERGITGMCINENSAAYKSTVKIAIPELNSMFLDDGWLTYGNGRLYMTAYTTGLFGAVACEGFSKIGYVDAIFDENGNVKLENPAAITLEGKTGFASAFIPHDGKGYVNAAGEIRVFNLEDMSEFTDLRQPSTVSHGSMVLRDTADGNLYLYVIPYQSNDICSISVVKYDSNFVGTSYSVSTLPHNFNSQAVRSDSEGRMIWYNDSGHVFNYTTPEKNNYFFFIEDENCAEWYQSTGSSASEAIANLGSDVITLDSMKKLASVWGEDVQSNWNILRLNNDAVENGNTLYFNNTIGTYTWTELPDFINSKYDKYHYYAILKEPLTKDDLVEGKKFLYATEEAKGGIVECEFRNNIGDRAIIGNNLVPGTGEVFTIRFYDGDAEMPGSALIGLKNSKVAGSFPSVSKTGYSGHWETADGQVVTSLPETFVSDSKYYLKWTNISYGLSGTVTESGNMTFFDISALKETGEKHIDYAHILLIAEYDGGVIFNLYSDDLDFTEGSAYAKLGVTTKNLVSVHAYIVSGTPTSGAFNNYGMYAYEVAA